MTDMMAIAIPWSYGIVCGLWGLAFKVAPLLRFFALCLSWIFAVLYTGVSALDCLSDNKALAPHASYRAPSVLALAFLPFYLNVCAIQAAFIVVGADIVYHTLTHTDHAD